MPDGVGYFLEKAGHSVERLRDVMAVDSPDQVVATACRESGLVLITHNIKDFHKIVKAHEVSKKDCDRLNRIEMDCRETNDVERLSKSLEIIEFEWNRLGQQKSGLRISISEKVIRSIDSRISIYFFRDIPLIFAKGRKPTHPGHCHPQPCR